MYADTKRTILFIKDSQSLFDLGTGMFQTLFNRVDIAQGRKDALELFQANTYDLVIGDLSVIPEGVGLLKQIKDTKAEQIIFAMLSPKDADKLYGIADLGIHAFELEPEQFDLALEAIAAFDPSGS